MNTLLEDRAKDLVSLGGCTEKKMQEGNKIDRSHCNFLYSRQLHYESLNIDIEKSLAKHIFKIQNKN